MSTYITFLIADEVNNIYGIICAIYKIFIFNNYCVYYQSNYLFLDVPKKLKV